MKEIKHKRIDAQQREILREATLEVVTNQIEAGEPPETAQTLERLLDEGISREEAMNMIGCVVVSEIFEVLGQNREFDRDKYVCALNALPAMPWDSAGYR
jgi:hypothetical protein